MGSASRSFFFMMALILLLAGCGKKNDPLPTITIMTLKWDISTPTATTDDWVFATDESGELLDIKPFEAGQTVTLQSNKITASQKFNITFFQQSKPATEDLFRFTSYLGVTSALEWTAYKKVVPAPAPSPPVASFTLNLDNCPAGLPYFWVSTNESILVGSGSPNASTYDLSRTFPATLVFLSTVRNSVPVYGLIITHPDGNYVLDYQTNLVPLDHLATYDLSGASYYAIDISCYTDDHYSSSQQGHIVARSSGSPTSSTFVTGWPKDYRAYKTSLLIKYPHSLKYYYRFGLPPETNPFLDITSTVTNSSYKNFTFTASGDYHLRTSGWANTNNTVTWEVNASPTGVQKFSDLPVLLTTKYPALNTVGLNHREMQFTKYLDSYTYNDYLENLGGNTAYSIAYQSSATF
jgi:hypothetical protein